MLAFSRSGSVVGIEPFLIAIEVDVSPGLPGFNIVGLPEGAVRESRERVRAAIKNCGYSFPSQKITVNLAPADIRKEGAGLDLPIALAILAATKVIPNKALEEIVSAGELSLDGSLRPIRGALPLALGCRKWPCRFLALPEGNVEEAKVAQVPIVAVGHLAEMVEVLRGTVNPVVVRLDDAEEYMAQAARIGGEELDLADVAGQFSAKRALEIAAAGGHNLLMTGPPGSGKTMLARRLPSILPPLTFEEALETSAIYSVAGLSLAEQPLVVKRPFRAPHHTISDAGMTGGGTVPKPGQVSLAHNGVLFLDELPEFRRNVLEALRQPLEDGMVTISRASTTITFPARFMLVAAQNPCPCGHLGDSRRECVCSPAQIARYRDRISGPLADRIDLHVEVPALPLEELTTGKGPPGESSESVRQRVLGARAIQAERFSGTNVRSNAAMGAAEIRRFCTVSAKDMSFVQDAADRLGMSARAFHKILKIARTIADLEGAARIERGHLAEAIGYRVLDRSGHVS